VRAARPITALDSVWVGVTDGGGMVQLVDPQTLTTVTYPDWTSPASGYYTAGYGSVGTYDWPAVRKCVGALQPATSQGSSASPRRRRRGEVRV
jgi:hypothetical protein